METDRKLQALERFLKVFYMVTQQLRISGRVQGVGYRDALRYEAERLGVTGWVRNRLDGSVEAVAQGAPEAVDRLIAWARRGPPAARVLELHVEAVQDADERPYSGFQRRPTV
jgi:acylphosphatase